MITQNGYVVAVKQSDAKYNTILQKIMNKPADPDGYTYRLRADNLEWELVELPPVPEDEDITADEALDIILGGGDA